MDEQGKRAVDECERRCWLSPSVGESDDKNRLLYCGFAMITPAYPSCFSPDREFVIENVDFVTDKDEDATNV